MNQLFKRMQQIKQERDALFSNPEQLARYHELLRKADSHYEEVGKEISDDIRLRTALSFLLSDCPLNSAIESIIISRIVASFCSLYAEVKKEDGLLQ